MTADNERYELRVAGPVARTLASRMPTHVASSVHAFITPALLTNPHQWGLPLPLPHYAGTWSARHDNYRVLYEIDEELRLVTVTAVEQLGDADPASRRR